MPELPPIPAQDFFFGLASGGVLLWTLMFLARSRILDRSLNQGDDDDIFYTLLKREESSQLSFLVSLFSHIFIIALIPWADAALPAEFRMNYQRYDTVVVQFKMDNADDDDALRLPADLAEVLPIPKEPAEADDGDEDDPGIGDGEEAAKLETDPGGKGRDTAPKLPLTPRFELAKQAPPAPAPEADLDLAAQAPEIDPGLTSYELAWAPPLPNPAAIPLPGVPVAGPPTDAELAAVNGLPTDLEAHPDAGGRPGFTDPAAAPGLGEFGTAGYGWVIGEGGKVNAWLTGQGLREMLASLERVGSGAGTGSGTGFGAGSDPGASGDGGEGFGTGFAGDQPVPRRLHGIIVISNDMQSMPEADGVLTGNPVYTVYVQVPGYRKKWILQVCLPRDEGGALKFEGGGVLRVLARKQLDPPYAVQRVAPELFMEDEDPFFTPPRIVVYFRVSEDGELLDQRIIAGVNEQTDNSVLASLENWQFHPAFHNGEPVAVEALFGIPLR